MKQRFLVLLGTLGFTLVVTGLSFAEISEEMKNAYNRAYQNNLTNETSIENGELEKTITRENATKILTDYSTKILGKKIANNNQSCIFEDENEINQDIKNDIYQACLLGIIQNGRTQFMPKSIITKAQFGTMLSRVLRGNIYEGGNPYYSKHLAALEISGIMKDINNPTEPITKGEVLLALLEASKTTQYIPMNITKTKNQTEYKLDDPEILEIINTNFTNEKEKQSIIDALEKNENKIREFIENDFNIEEIDFNNENSIEIFKEKMHILIDEKMTNYINEIEKIYKIIGIDLEDTREYSLAEKHKKTKELLEEEKKYSENINNLIDSIYKLDKNITIDETGNLIFESDIQENNYKTELIKLYQLWNEYKETFEEAQDNYQIYTQEYVMNNPKRAQTLKNTATELGNNEQYKIDNAIKNDGNTVIRKDGSMYEGELINNVRNGKGKMTYYDGSYLSGTRVNDIFDGYGEINNITSYYTGEIKRNIIHGKGIESYNDQSIYSGEFKLGKKYGKGILTKKNGIKFEGKRRNGEPIKGTITYINGSTYSGNLENFKESGIGTIKFTGGETFEGLFLEGNITGPGTLTLKNGNKISGERKNGYLQKEKYFIHEGKLIDINKITITENQWNNTIIIYDGKDSLTLMNKNINAKTTGTNQNSYGSYFKIGNTTPFSSEKTDDHQTFINEKSGNRKYKEQGPCPTGYHIPTLNERERTKTLWLLKEGEIEKDLTVDNIDRYMEAFKLPFAGYRSYIDLNTAIRYNYLITPNTTPETIVEKAKTQQGDKIYYNEDINLIGKYHISDTNNGNLTLIKTQDNVLFGLGINATTNEAYPIRCFKN